MKDWNAQMAAMQAQFEETIAKLREDLTARLRVQEEANKTMREEKEEAAKREATTMGTGAAARQGAGGQGVRTSVSDSLIRLHYSTRSPPKMPNDPAKTLSWIRRFEIFWGSENLTHICYESLASKYRN